MLLEVLVHGGHCLVFHRVEIRLARKETEQVIEEVVNALTLLHTCHEQAIKLLCHISFFYLSFI